MFRFVGFLVVTGFAIYGASKFIDGHVVGEKDSRSKSGDSPRADGVSHA